MSFQKVALCEARGPLNDLNDKLSGNDGHLWLEGLKRFLRHEDPWLKFGTTIDPIGRWPENPGVIYLRYVSGGKTHEEWFKRLEGMKLVVPRFLMADGLETTSGKDYVIVILKGSLWEDASRTTRNILATAKIRGLAELCPEAALLTVDGIGDTGLRGMGVRRVVSLSDPFSNDRQATSRTLMCLDHEAAHWDAPACLAPDFRWEWSASFAFKLG